jgi:hypothetical protein
MFCGEHKRGDGGWVKLGLRRGEIGALRLDEGAGRVYPQGVTRVRGRTAWPTACRIVIVTANAGPR